MHSLKVKHQRERRFLSWRRTIVEHRRRILLALEDSPSLKPYLGEVFEQGYAAARQDAATETSLPLATFPERSPFTIKQILAVDYLL